MKKKLTSKEFENPLVVETTRMKDKLCYENCCENKKNVEIPTLLAEHFSWIAFTYPPAGSSARYLEIVIYDNELQKNNDIKHVFVPHNSIQIDEGEIKNRVEVWKKSSKK